MRVKIGKKVLKPAAKHAVKVRLGHVWAGMSQRGATNICAFDQILDGVLYTQILDKYLLPFIEKLFHGTEYRFMQDNDPKHTSRVAKDFYQAKSINWWPAAQIEGVWRELKHFIDCQVKPLSKKELSDGICLLWKKRMTPEKCIKYINHTFTNLPKSWLKRDELEENDIHDTLHMLPLIILACENFFICKLVANILM